MSTAAQMAEASVVLSELSIDELTQTIQAALTARVGREQAAALRVYISAFLDEETYVGRLAGPPSKVIANLDAERMYQLFIRSTAHRAVLDEPLLESSAVAQALGRTGTNGREAASKLRLSSRIVGVRQQNRYLYPAFQFDLDHNRVHDVAAAVNRLLDALHDPWGVASWWVVSSPRLGGMAPKELLGTDREADLETLARAESAE